MGFGDNPMIHDERMVDLRTPSGFRGARRFLGITVSQLSHELEMGERTLWKYEAGDVRIPGPVRAYIRVMLTARGKWPLRVAAIPAEDGARL